MHAQVGDWGRQGTLNQTAVAALMARVADSVKPEFVLSMGDNFYESVCLGPATLSVYILSATWACNGYMQLTYLLTTCVVSVVESVSCRL